MTNRRFAEEHEKRDDNAGAVELYRKCLSAAAASKDLRAEGLATFRLGQASAAMGEKQAAIEHHERYLKICKQIGDQPGEGQAYAALAHAFKETGDLKLAVVYLERYLDIGVKSKNAAAQVRADRAGRHEVYRTARLLVCDVAAVELPRSRMMAPTRVLNPVSRCIACALAGRGVLGAGADPLGAGRARARRHLL